MINRKDMLTGPTYVYECPQCGNLLTNSSLESGNSMGAEYFSDGKVFAPMLPEFPDLTKCKKCDHIFWLSKLEEIGRYQWSDEVNPQWESADMAMYLEINDLYRAIRGGIAETKEEELNIREQIWRAYNDRIRNGEPIFQDANDEALWKENVTTLLALFDQSDRNEKLMIAEIYRNLGEFEKSISILNGIEGDDLDWIRRRLKKECKRKNRWVVQLNPTGGNTGLFGRIASIFKKLWREFGPKSGSKR